MTVIADNLEVDGALILTPPPPTPHSLSLSPAMLHLRVFKARQSYTERREVAKRIRCHRTSNLLLVKALVSRSGLTKLCWCFVWILTNEKLLLETSVFWSFFLKAEKMLMVLLFPRVFKGLYLIPEVCKWSLLDWKLSWVGSFVFVMCNLQ